MLNKITVYSDAPESLREAIVNYNEVADSWNECITNSHICACEVLDFGEDIDPDKLIGLMNESKNIKVRIADAINRVEEEVSKLDIN